MNTLTAPAQADVDALLDRLDGVRGLGADRWLAKCPAHPDQHPSLDVRLAYDGKILLCCRAGCRADEILQALSLDWAALFPNDPARPVRHSQPESELDRARRSAARRARRGGERARDRAGIDLASDAIQEYSGAAVEWRQLGRQLGPDHPGAWSLLALAAEFDTQAANLESMLEELRAEKIA